MREYISKGFALDDAYLKKGGRNYFDELLARIRDIRSSEKCSGAIEHVLVDGATV